MDSLKGATLLKADGSKVEAEKALENKVREWLELRADFDFTVQDLVLYYFSAHWCPPCRQFTPMLKDFYEVTRLLMKVKIKYVCQEAEGIEIVFVSSDRSAEDMTSYMKVIKA